MCTIIRCTIIYSLRCTFIDSLRCTIIYSLRSVIIDSKCVNNTNGTEQTL